MLERLYCMCGYIHVSSEQFVSPIRSMFRHKSGFSDVKILGMQTGKCSKNVGMANGAGTEHSYHIFGQKM